MSLKEVKRINALVDTKPFFDQPLKTKQETYAKIVEMLKNNDDITEHLLSYLYHQNDYKLVGIDSSRLSNAVLP